MKHKKINHGLVALAALGGMLATSCGSETDVYDPNAAVVDYNNDWKEAFGAIDPAQTWNTSETSKVDVSSDADGTVRIFAAAAIGNHSAALITRSIKAGETLTLTVAKPQWATELFAAYYDADGYITEENFTVSDNAKVAFTTAADAAGAKAAIAKTRATLIDQFGSKERFPDYDDSGYDKTIPADAVDISNEESGSQGQKFYVTESTNNIAINYACEIYFGPGTYTLKDFNIASGTNVYILAGATVNLTVEYTSTHPDVNIYINNGAVLNTVEYSANTFTYNRGTMNINGDLKVKKDNTMFVNEGKVNVSGDVNVIGMFWNVNEIQVAGNTKVNNEGLYWVNDNLYHTGSFNYETSGTLAINNCKVIVDETTTIDINKNVDVENNKFFINGGAYLKTKNLTFSNGIISMADNAMVKVDETVTMNLGNNKNLRIEGVGADTSNPALFIASEIAAKSSPSISVQYTGNLIVATDSHFTKHIDKKTCYTATNGAKVAQTQNGAGVNFTATQCHPGYESGATTITTGYVYYAFEDLGSSNDFDFNDVVVRVSAPDNGESTIQLCAAGGTIPTYVYYDGKVIGSEVHEAFGVDETTMVNTTSVNKAFVTLGTITVADGADISNLDIAIMIEGQTSREVSTPATGEAPMMIRVSGDESGKWMWPTERTSISTAYPGFGAWGSNYNTSTDWYQNPADGKVVSY